MGWGGDRSRWRWRWNNYYMWGGGLRGRTNIASWVVAGTIAYFLWVKPSQDLRKQQEKSRPIPPDPQETGLIYGNKNRSPPPPDDL